MAEVIGTISASLHLAETIITYFHGVHDAPRHAADLQEEIEAVSQVLGLLRDFLLDRSHAGGNLRFDRTSVLFSAATGCERRLRAVDATLSPILGSGTDRVTRLWRRATWPLAREETMESVRAIHRYAQVFHFATTVEGLSALSLTQHDALGRIEARLESMDSRARDQTAQQLQEISDAVRDLPGISSQLRSLNDRVGGLVIDNQMSQLLASIPTLEFRDRHRNLQLTRMEGASQWILDMDKFVAWRDGPSTNGALWCNGAPGAGKTYLASVVTDHLMDVCSQEGNSAHVLYFYFDYKKQADQTPLKFLQTLLHQLLCTHSHVPKEAEKIFNDIRNGKGLPSWKDMKAVFINLCNASASRLFIVFDALDECDASANRGPVVELINDIKKSRARLVVTSRPYPPDIDKLFGDCPQILVEASDSDIRAFVLDQIAQSDQMSSVIGESLKEKIVTSILAKSQGMFLLPALQINNILGQTSKREIEVALGTLPTGLADNLAMTIERIKSQHAQSQTRARLALGVLQWLSTVRRQITARELQHAIAVSRLGKNDTKLDLEDLTKPTYFVDCCFGLVIIDGETSIIRLVHFSVNEYLQEQRGVLFDDPDGDLAACCLSYITACATSLRRRALSVTSHELSSKWALWQYAIQHWGVHARTCSDQRVMDRLAGFISVPAALELWSRHLVSSPAVSRPQSEDDAAWLVAARFVTQKTPALHIAAIYGIYQLAVDCLAKDPASVNARDDAGATPLMLAAANGSKGVLELLISREAIELNAKDRDGATALIYAIRSTQPEMVQQLVSLHPQLDINLGNVINTACNRNRYGSQSTDADAITALLLDHPAFDLLRQSAHAPTDDPPWYGLGVEFKLDNLRKLLARPDFDAWRYSWAPSHRLSSCQDSMNYLLNTDYDVELFGLDPLVAASAIALLLDREFPEESIDFMALRVVWPMVYYAFGPYVMTEEDKLGHSEVRIKIAYSGIWDHADETGREELRDALERDGISFDSTDSKGRGFLHFLAESIAGNNWPSNDGGDGTEYMRYLVGRGTSIDTRDHKGRTPLHYAAKEGIEEVVRLFIEAGGDPLAADNSGLTVLHYATESRKENLDLVRLLLELGADITATSTEGASVLHHAAQHGAGQTLVAFLIGKGASLESKNRFGETPIMYSMWGDVGTTKALLELGADPLQTTPSSICALTRAVLNMDSERTKMCLTKVKKAEDLSDPRCFGMSILDYLSHFGRAVATELGFTDQHWAAYVPTPPEERKRNARKAIGARLEWMAEATDETARMLTDLTGYLLIQAGDDEAAKIMTEQGIELKSKYLSSPVYEHQCSNCETYATPQVRCCICPWVNFCQACALVAPANRDQKMCDKLVLKCSGHEFLEFGGEEWKSLPDGKVNKEGLTFREYVKALQRKYPPPTSDEPQGNVTGREAATGPQGTLSAQPPLPPRVESVEDPFAQLWTEMDLD